MASELETATCMPRQIPRYGSVLARDAAGLDLAFHPREPKPPGTSTPSTPELGARLLERHVLGVDPADVHVAAG